MLGNIGSNPNLVPDDKILDEIIKKNNSKVKTKENEVLFADALQEKLIEEQKLIELIKKSGKKEKKNQDSIALLPSFIHIPRIIEDPQIKLFTDKKNRCHKCGRFLSVKEVKSVKNRNENQGICQKCFNNQQANYEFFNEDNLD